MLRHTASGLEASLSPLRSLFALFLFAGVGSYSHFALAETTLTRSITGQFLVHDTRGSGPSQAASRLGTNAAFVVLDPTILAVSALFPEEGPAPSTFGVGFKDWA